jgi:hypothetical protein
MNVMNDTNIEDLVRALQDYDSEEIVADYRSYTQAATAWDQHNFDIASARLWWDAGCYQAKAASDLRGAGICPSEVTWPALSHGCPSLAYVYAGGYMTIGGITAWVRKRRGL